MPPCPCPSCHVRRLTTPLVLIAVGVLLLVRMLHPNANPAALIAAFLVFAGVLGLLRRLAPQPAARWAAGAAAANAPAVPHPQPGSLFAPLLLVTVGVLILARHLLPPFPIGAWIANYWPLLLILWGLTRLVEHYTRPPRSAAGSRAGSGMSAAEILLLILIVVFGLSFSAAYRFGHSRWANYWGVNVAGWNPFLQSFDFDANAQAALDPRQTVVIRGYRGDVTLIAAPAGQPPTLAAAVADTVHADGRDSAQRLFDASQPLIRAEGDRAIVLPAGDDSSNGHGNLQSDLRLTLPPSTPVVIELQDGDITIPAWSADLNLRSTHGSITAGHVQGSVQVASGHDSVSLDQISGSVSVSGAGDDLAISNVTGDVTVQGEFVGSLNFRNLAHGVHFNSSRTGLRVAALPGSLAYDMGQITIANASDIQLRTRDAAIDIRQFTGPIEVQNRDQAVELTSDVIPQSPITVTDRNADVTLTLPAASRFNLEADAHNGNVDNAFAATSASSGPTLHLETSNGTIALQKR